MAFYNNENIFGNLKSLSNLTKLIDLDVSLSNIKGDIKSLKNCINLRNLDISDTKIKGNMEFLLDFKCLHDLSIMDSKISYSAKLIDELYKNTRVDIVEINSDEEFEEEENKGIVHYDFVGDKGVEELTITISDFPRVNPESLAFNIDMVLSENGLGYVTDDEVDGENLIVKVLVIEMELTQEILIKEFFEYGISFDKEISNIFN